MERYALFARLPEVRQQAWGWGLWRKDDGVTFGEGHDREEFRWHQERPLPEVCVPANLIDGPDLTRALRGCPSGPERAIPCSDHWCTSDQPLRCAVRATDLFHRLCPEGGVDMLDYGPDGRLMVTARRPLGGEEVHMALLSNALA